jgi:hypothetical protein
MNMMMALGNGVYVMVILFVVLITSRLGILALNTAKITVKIGPGSWDSNAQLP